MGSTANPAFFSLTRVGLRQMDQMEGRTAKLAAWRQAKAKLDAKERKLLVLQIRQLAPSRHFRIRRGFRVRAVPVEGRYRLNISPGGKLLVTTYVHVRMKDGRPYLVCDTCQALARELCLTQYTLSKCLVWCCRPCRGIPRRLPRID